jgi:predicted transcriptional regulator
MKIMKIAVVPPPSIQRDCTIRDAVPLLERHHGCAVAVMDGERIAGVLSKDDIFKSIVR